MTFLKNPHLRHPAQLDGALERRNGLGNGAPTQGDKTQAPVRVDEAGGMVDLASDPEGLLPLRHCFGELAQLDEAPGELRARDN